MTPPNPLTRKRSVFRAPAALLARAEGPLINPSEAARLLGISVSELTRRVNDGIYPCHRDDKGWRWFPEHELRRMMKQSKAAEPPPDTPVAESTNLPGTNAEGAPAPPKRKAGRPWGSKNKREDSGPALSSTSRRGYSIETAKKVFVAIREKKSAVEIVVELGVMPDVVHALAREYAELEGLKGASLCAICRKNEAGPCSSCAMPV
jgi:hypothetical protein